MQDAPLRNLWITQCYHELALELGAVIGGPDANWCSYATWASKTAGNFIRNEHVPETVRALLEFEDLMESTIDQVLGLIFGRAPAPQEPDLFDRADSAIRRVSQQIAAGNLKVFRELAPVFTSFCDTFRDVDAPDEARFAAFASQFAKGPTQAGGQDALRHAFRAYYDAKFEPDPRQRAQYMFYGNGLIGLHEQTRLQPNIAAALEAPMDELFGRGERAVLRAAWLRIVTRTMMTLGLPEGPVQLGEDVPVRGSREFPCDLVRLDWPPLVAFVHTYDRNPASLAGSGAENWTSLHDRMNYILDLFRSTQRDASLHLPPFTSEQRAALELGRMPEGRL